MILEVIKPSAAGTSPFCPNPHLPNDEPTFHHCLWRQMKRKTKPQDPVGLKPLPKRRRTTAATTTKATSTDRNRSSKLKNNLFTVFSLHTVLQECIFLGRCLSSSSSMDPRHLEAYIYGFWTMLLLRHISHERHVIRLLQPQWPIWSSQDDNDKRMLDMSLLSTKTTPDGGARGVYVDLAIVIVQTEPRWKVLRYAQGVISVAKLAGQTLGWFFENLYAMPMFAAFEPAFLRVVGLRAPILLELKLGPPRHSLCMADFHRKLTALLQAAKRQAEKQARALYASWRFIGQEFVITVAVAGEYMTMRRWTRKWGRRTILQNIRSANDLVRLRGIHPPPGEGELLELFASNEHPANSETDSNRSTSPFQIPAQSDSVPLAGNQPRSVTVKGLRWADEEPNDGDFVPETASQSSESGTSDSEAAEYHSDAGSGESDGDIDETDHTVEELIEMYQAKLSEYDFRPTGILDRHRERIARYCERLDELEVEANDDAEVLNKSGLPKSRMSEIRKLRGEAQTTFEARNAARDAYYDYGTLIAETLATQAGDSGGVKTRFRKKHETILENHEARLAAYLEEYNAAQAAFRTAARTLGASMPPTQGGLSPPFSDDDLDIYNHSLTASPGDVPFFEKNDPARFFAGEEDTAWTGVIRLGSDLAEKYLQYIEDVVREFEDEELERRSKVKFPQYTEDSAWDSEDPETDDETESEE
ncbi:hypothetical protein MIND_00790800 [Mycena indigotica]|uniref:Uncharacterized protein n=1 Tax=Mycena indigotica TaxID=2126181 RepID=A0A8H6W584_9AGAR|nr:uncharacterized protein MIND_00790800 [Mycena indigotica]KAF7302238.1 hypothetical protein MIND_00790800 [Mycena indigotica]